MDGQSDPFNIISDTGGQRLAWLYVSAVCVGVCVVYAASRLWRCVRRRRHELPARDVSKGHHWVATDTFAVPTHCSVSARDITSRGGAVCDACGVCVERRHAAAANRQLRCKPLSTKSGVGRTHHWVSGNLGADAVCAACDIAVDARRPLTGRRCCWCAMVMHDACGGDATPCDLGAYAALVVPPECVSLRLVGVKGRRHYIVGAVTPPPRADWAPLIVIANRRSGNGDGQTVLSAFRRLLNPAQVIDLAEISPESALEWCHLLPEVTCRVLVAGGDGTVGWVLHAIDELNLKPAPQICILPLGTGNDLSRVLGWGEGYTSDTHMSEIIAQIEVAKVVHLDRWQVEILPEKHFGFRMPKRKLIMNNYASIGVDALVTLNFHLHRENCPALFGNRLINKLWYLTYGTKDVLERECKYLDRKLKVELDGKEVKLPEIEGVVILNIASWGGGCKPWKMGGSPSKAVPEARYDDGLVEVFALYSSFHIAQLQVGLAEPLRLGQAAEVKLTLHKGNAPMQVDGEPWEQHPAVITIRAHNQATMLARADR